MDSAVHHTSIGFVSTYPPTVCGLATYTASLIDAIAHDRNTRHGLHAVSLTDRSHSGARPDVVVHHRVGDAGSLAVIARVLNSYDTVSIQHEYGIYGGPDGDEVLDLMDRLEVPTAVTFHTVLDQPSSHQRMITEHLAESADRVIVMSQTASDRLVLRYDLEPSRIAVIPHGADSIFAGPSLAKAGRPLALTWGLIGPGKGLEAAIQAFAGLRALDVAPRYLIAGATHPHVKAAAGETYRQSLVSLVDRLDLQDIVEFDDRYLGRTSLAALVRSADLVVLPYESVEQVTSGVLVEAIAASKPVVATRFPHAVELLASGAGITVHHGDTAAMTTALRGLVQDPTRRSEMAREAGRLAEGWFWPTVGRTFADLMSEIAASSRVPRRAVHPVAV